MQFLPLILTFLPAVAPGAAVVHPRPANRQDLAAENNSFIYARLCPLRNLGGDCQEFITDGDGSCDSIVGTTMDNKAVSVEVGGEACCTFYDDPDCKSSSLFTLTDGRIDLLNNEYKNRISSFQCRFGTGCPLL
ncbi:Protein of unknown function [Pyronema omphalodes CBS 100304]|uniref:Uncharacterized protein n=1 Tax=Pyronema omphalodes (strain CBS 100304) TaxID=1076935 RepID=U4KYT7_PYROM|nr:Protein of unknown function [Pyronema omphalodes CBS 100304]